MKAKKFSRIFLWCGIAAFLFAVGFVWYALNHPEHGTPFGLSLAGTWILYGTYLFGTVLLFALGVCSGKKNGCVKPACSARRHAGGQNLF